MKIRSKIAHHISAWPVYMQALHKDSGASPLASLSLEQPVGMANSVPPAAWLQRLVNDEQFLGPRELAALMAASWDMCEAVLRVIKQRRYFVEVSRHGGLPRVSGVRRSIWIT